MEGRPFTHPFFAPFLSVTLIFLISITLSDHFLFKSIKYATEVRIYYQNQLIGENLPRFSVGLIAVVSIFQTQNPLLIKLAKPLAFEGYTSDAFQSLAMAKEQRQSSLCLHMGH